MKLRQSLKVIGILLLSVIWNEFAYYYVHFYLQNGFKWPAFDSASTGASQNYQSFTRILIIADTHIMGPIKSNWLDKWRREWEMQQSFKISNSIYKPDIIIFLGDLLDEGSYFRDSSFYKASEEFDRIFKFDESRQKRIVIAGNHDVGFHDRMTEFPFILHRFASKYETTTSIELAKFNKLNIISSNSMAFYNDQCSVCSEAISATNQISRYLDRERNTILEEYSEPILLTHIPLYRKDDAHCDHPYSMEHSANEQGRDVLHKEASQFLLKRLRPRLIISGHTHMNCKIRHTAEKTAKVSEELTVTSYNHKYALKEPGFLLMNANSTHIYTKSCSLIDEKIVATVYIATLILICSIIFKSHP